MAKAKFTVPTVKVGKAAEQALAKAAAGGFNIPKTNGKSAKVTGYMRTGQKTYTPPANKR